MPQLVALDCSLTHVLQAPNTHPNTVKSWMDGLGLYVSLSIFIDKDHMLGQGPLHYFSKIKDCRVVMPENWVSNLNSHKKAGIICGVVTPKDNLWNDKTSLQTMKMSGRSWEKLNPGKNLNFAVKKVCIMYDVDLLT